MALTALQAVTAIPSLNGKTIASHTILGTRNMTDVVEFGYRFTDGTTLNVTANESGSLDVEITHKRTT